MKCRSFVTVTALAFLFALVAEAEVSRAVLTEADIVFTGKVERDGPVAPSEIPEGTPAVTVVIDRIIVKPTAVVLAKDNRITVAIAGSLSNYPAGTRATFYTVGWIYGDTVAVRELAHEASAPPGAFAPATLPASIDSDLRDAKLARLIDEADAVVVGRVVSVGPSTPAAAPAGGSAQPVSEHEPQWRDATVQVESWLKGVNQQQQIVVRFPASIDVAWYNVPKLKSGMEGTFLLHKDRFSGRAAARTAGGLNRPTFALIAPTDLVPANDAPRARRLMSEK
ncbi:MAG TPA: hypothetical protein VH394_12935 [Thermoanaerobaculia bacterium]|nr:hypothetical protein [Thermoanaerobaculia bacterium]